MVSFTRCLSVIAIGLSLVAGEADAQVPRAFTPQKLRTREQFLLEQFNQARSEVREVRERLNSNLLPFLNQRQVREFRAEETAKIQKAQDLRSRILDLRSQLREREQFAQRNVNPVTPQTRIAVVPPQPPVQGIALGTARQAGAIQVNPARANLGAINPPSSIGKGIASTGSALQPGSNPARANLGAILGTGSS